MPLLYFTKTSGLKSARDSIYFLTISPLPPFLHEHEPVWAAAAGSLSLAVQGTFFFPTLAYISHDS